MYVSLDDTIKSNLVFMIRLTGFSLCGATLRESRRKEKIVGITNLIASEWEH